MVGCAARKADTGAGNLDRARRQSGGHIVPAGGGCAHRTGNQSPCRIALRLALSVPGRREAGRANAKAGHIRAVLLPGGPAVVPAARIQLQMDLSRD